MRKWIIPVFLGLALLICAGLSIFTIHGLQGYARVINYSGVVRGATQRLVKQELYGQANDELIARLDGIIDELIAGGGDNRLVRMEDEYFQSLLSEMRERWAVLKDEIEQVRGGADKAELFELSESYFVLVDRAVSAAEVYSEHQIRRAEETLLFLCAVFLLPAALLAWYGVAQDKRQQYLAEAEADNQAKRENLERMSQDLRAPMDDISELMYVSDMENNDLLYINEAGRRTFGISDLTGLKCYKVLQGQENPCEFCTSSKLVPGENYTWEITNPITHRHYLLKDRLIQWEGRMARMEIAFDMTEAEAEKQALKNALDAEQMIMGCVRSLYQEHDMDQSILFVLECVNRFLAADRAYLGMMRNHLIYNDYEWCGEGVASQKELLQGLPLSSIDRWLPVFSRQECVIIEDLEQIRGESPEEYELLHVQGIHSLVAAPMERDGELIGFLGVDNPPPDQIRSIAPLLQTLCYFLMLTYRREESEQQLSHLSYYDTLTSYYNRNRYMEDCAKLIGSDGPVGIVYLDVNGLKDINDQKGHAYGDEVLVGCTKLTRAVFQDADYYRIGGDEFVVICPGIGEKTFEERVSSLHRQFENNGICHVAIGAEWSAQRDGLHQLIAAADAQMYEDKKEYYRSNPASNRYRHHSDEILHLTNPEVLKDEIRQERFIVYLQPKVNSREGSAVGAEALIRYQPRSGSMVLPGDFLPLLEESRTVSQIDFYVFEHVCAQLQTWAGQGRRVLPIAVNFSRCSLSEPNFVERLSALCEQYGVEKSCLEIELTETAQVADGLDLKSLISDLRHAGFHVSIDDFGTEFANLALLSTVEFDLLKLDKSLVDDVALNPKARTVVESIVSICKKMGIEVVAEGIETAGQLGALRACGVELVQGFLFSRPIPIEAYEEKYLNN